ncbi:hypothetical protein [Spirillospora sp. NBC_01491]|uniref:hypothetical protein n=1 Tax=Spirillospora sp. NBC_01491 TaxID=2976007 RepID=UPI002E2FC0A0|nr:hypothetical protein [Spirillospora sp. NBC_01491]
MKTDELTAATADQLKRTGEIRATYHSHHDRDRLRAAGRQAGRLIARPVRTFDIPATPTPRCSTEKCGTVVITVTNWGTNPLEARLTESRANNAVDRALASDQH